MIEAGQPVPPQLAHRGILDLALAGFGTQAIFLGRIGDAPLGGKLIDFGGAEGEFRQEAGKARDFPAGSGFLQGIALIGQCFGQVGMEHGLVVGSITVDVGDLGGFPLPLDPVPRRIEDEGVSV